MSEQPAFYKVLAENRSAFHGGSGKWTPGRWRSVRGELEPCVRGLHVVTLEQLPQWLGPAIWRVETDGELIDASGKWVARRARITERLDGWNERTARLFACDCAEHVLPIFEKRHPNDTRPRDAIAVARRFANGEAAREERDAAWAAAWDAARDAERDAAWDAAGAAAWAAAGAAAWAAAGAAAGAAAWDAAGDAAWDAAGAAAGAAAWDAAWDAARAAESKWQAERLAEYLGIKP